MNTSARFDELRETGIVRPFIRRAAVLNPCAFDDVAGCGDIQTLLESGQEDIALTRDVEYKVTGGMGPPDCQRRQIHDPGD